MLYSINLSETSGYPYPAVSACGASSSFSKTKLFENDEWARRAPRDFAGLRFSKLVLETIFSIRTIATSFDNKEGPYDGP